MTFSISSSVEQRLADQLAERADDPELGPAARIRSTRGVVDAAAWSSSRPSSRAAAAAGGGATCGPAPAGGRAE